MSRPRTNQLIALLVGAGLLTSIGTLAIVAITLAQLLESREVLARQQQLLGDRATIYARHKTVLAEYSQQLLAGNKDALPPDFEEMQQYASNQPEGLESEQTIEARESLLRMLAFVERLKDWSDGYQQALQRQNAAIDSVESTIAKLMAVKQRITGRMEFEAAVRIRLIEREIHGGTGLGRVREQVGALLRMPRLADELLDLQILVHEIEHISSRYALDDLRENRLASSLGNLREDVMDQGLSLIDEHLDLLGAYRDFEYALIGGVLHWDAESKRIPDGEEGLLAARRSVIQREEERAGLTDMRDGVLASLGYAIRSLENTIFQQQKMALDQTGSLLRQGLWALAILFAIVVAVSITIGIKLPAAIRSQLQELQDLNTRIQTQAKENERLSLIASRTDNAVVLTDPVGRIEWVNAAFERLTGYRLEEALGHTPGSLLQTPDTDPAVRALMRARIEAGEPFSAQIVNRSRSGRLYWVDIEAQPLWDKEGRLVHFMAMERDITDQKEWERKLIDAKEAAEAASRAKADFLAMMSHEIRTPLHGILGFASVLNSMDLGAQEREYVGTIESSSEALLAIINDILDLSKIDAGRLTIELRPTQPRRLVEEVLRLLQVKAAEKQLEISSFFADELPTWIQTDEHRLRQILMNLIGNSIKFTEKGGVQVALRTLTLDQERCRLEVSIADTGIGMTQDQIAKLFRPFTQADNSTTRRFGGTGLGLAICKRLIEALGGEITVVSQPKQGSTFTFTLEAALAGAPDGSARSPSGPVGQENTVGS